MSGPEATTNARDVSIIKVVCGGETGADRAAVDFALSHHVAYGGWVPSGGWAEDYCEPPGLLAIYPEFVATQSTDPAVRTTLNYVTQPRPSSFLRPSPPRAVSLRRSRWPTSSSDRSPSSIHAPPKRVHFSRPSSVA
jgi:hypothetical protein